MTLELRISAEILAKIVWIVSIVFSSIGFLMLLAGIVTIFTVDPDDFDAFGGVITGVGLILGGFAIAAIPYYLASSVTNFLKTMNESDDAEEGEVEEQG